MKFILVIGLCITQQVAFSQPAKNVITIKGSIKGQQDGTLVLMYSDLNGVIKRDTGYITKGSFSFTAEIKEPVMASLCGRIKSRSMDDPNFANFFLEPGKDITIGLVADHFKDGVIKGSPVQDEYYELLRSKKKITEKYQKQLDSLRSEKDHEKNAEIRERLAPYFNEMNEEDYRFFKKHPASFVTAYMLRFHVDELSPESLQAFYDAVGNDARSSSYGKYIADEIIKLRNGSPGAMAANFVTTDINGKKLSLSDFRGRYVLVDFWASWCVPCRKGNPHLKQVYAKYKDRGMEIIGIADDDRAQDAWRKAVEKDGIGMWRHVLRGLQFNNGDYDRTNDISEKFGIHTLPTRILIDTNGKIIGRFGEKEDELDKMLKELFGG